MRFVIHWLRWYVYLTYWFFVGHRLAHLRHETHDHAGFRDSLAGRF